MKTAFLLLTASLVIAASGAFAQGGNTDACHNNYGSCMERCSGRPASLQESCSNSCEANTNQCYSQMYGPKSALQAIQASPAQASAPEEVRDARDEAKPEEKPQAKPAKAQKKR